MFFLAAIKLPPPKYYADTHADAGIQKMFKFGYSNDDTPTIPTFDELSYIKQMYKDFKGPGVLAIAKSPLLTPTMSYANSDKKHEDKEDPVEFIQEFAPKVAQAFSTLMKDERIDFKKYIAPAAKVASDILPELAKKVEEENDRDIVGPIIDVAAHAIPLIAEAVLEEQNFENLKLTAPIFKLATNLLPILISESENFDFKDILHQAALLAIQGDTELISNMVDLGISRDISAVVSRALPQIYLTARENKEKLKGLSPDEVYEKAHILSSKFIPPFIKDLEKEKNTDYSKYIGPAISIAAHLIPLVLAEEQESNRDYSGVIAAAAHLIPLAAEVLLEEENVKPSDVIVPAVSVAAHLLPLLLAEENKDHPIAKQAASSAAWWAIKKYGPRIVRTIAEAVLEENNELENVKPSDVIVPAVSVAAHLLPLLLAEENKDHPIAKEIATSAAFKAAVYGIKRYGPTIVRFVSKFLEEENSNVKPTDVLIPTFEIAQKFKDIIDKEAQVQNNWKEYAKTAGKAAIGAAVKYGVKKALEYGAEVLLEEN